MREQETHIERNAVDRGPSRTTWPPPWLAAISAKPTAEPPQPTENQAKTAILPPPKPAIAPIEPVVDQPTATCDRCRSARFRDSILHHAPHYGRSTRRDCATCGRFRAFVVWYGTKEEP